MRIAFAVWCAPRLSFPIPLLACVALVQAGSQACWPLPKPRLKVPCLEHFQTPYSCVQQGTGAVCTCTALAQATIDLVLGEIHCGYTRRLHSSPSGPSSLKWRLFNVLLLSRVPNTTIVAAKEWTKGAGLACFPETASPAAVIRGGRVGYMGPWSRQPGRLLGFYFLLPIPFHSCWIRLLYSSLGIVSQTHGLSFVLFLWTAVLFTCSVFRMA